MLLQSILTLEYRMLFSLLMACWMDSSTLPTLNINVINFTNEYLERDVEVRIYDSPLVCPDGEAASFFLVLPKSDEPVPVSIVFHSGAMDYSAYVDDPAKFRASGRLLSEWGSSRVWETLNLSRKTLDTAVTDLGYLPTALANAGIAQVYPTNCWGDLWHNGAEFQGNDAESEGYVRQGLDMAQFAVDILSNTELAESTGFSDVQEKLDPVNFSLIGLGTGGQAIYELLALGIAPSATVFDSSPSTFEAYLDGDFEVEQEALNRIFGTADLSTASLNVNTLPERTGWIWSNGDSQHPLESLELGAEAVDALPNAWVIDQNETGHVFSNRDYTLARQTTQYIMTGDSAIDDAQTMDDTVDTASE